ncbi:MAG: phage tail tube protein [Candidatus Bathyarchaeota archaeon]|nr:phage tail tube protein [Candidatus Bathyarchaeota archaeon]
MPETYGAHECRVYYVQETAYGQTPANPTMIGINAESLDSAVEPSLVKVRGVGSRDLIALKRGLRKPALKLSHVLPSDAPISFIQHVQTLNSLSVQVLWFKGLFSSATDIISLLYKGMRIDKLTVECAIDDLVKAEVELLGQDLVVGTSKIAGATYAEYEGAVAYTESYVQRGAADGSGLAALTRVTDWKFTVENNLKPVPVIRSASAHLARYLPARHRELSGELTFEFEDKSEFEDVINDAEFSLKFGLGGSNYALFKHCKWENVQTPVRIEDLVSLKARFIARDVVIA